MGKRDRSEKRILIAEDSPLLRKLLFDTMNEAGYVNVEFFENGRDAYDYLESLAKSGNDVTEHIQLVVTDIEMPQMDGHHLTRKIKEHPDLQKLPVIIFSSLITDDLRHKGDQVGQKTKLVNQKLQSLFYA